MYIFVAFSREISRLNEIANYILIYKKKKRSVSNKIEWKIENDSLIYTQIDICLCLYKTNNEIGESWAPFP